MLYLTPERFRTMGLGADLTGMEDWELRSVLTGATHSVNRYCNTPLQPSQYDFRGGSMVDESHDFTSRRIFLRSKPIKAVSALRLYVTNQQFLEVNVNNIWIDPETSWIELFEASLTSVGLWGAAIFPGIGLQQIQSLTSYTYGYSFPVTGETLEPTDGQTWRAQNQFWDTGEDFTVYVNGTEKTTDVEFDVTEGTVRFTANDVDFDDIVTVDYTYTLPFEIARATGLVATSSLAERDLFGKGLGNLAEIQVEEVRLRRDARRSGTVVAADAIPNAAAVLLDAFRFVTVM